uniref:Uncharacterized protein n=1 Tax=viral metagenome TaxID=1070528 RepID=A0A6M3JSJ3_9ZZZZ
MGMRPEDIIVVQYRDPQPATLWVELVSLIQRGIDAETYVRTKTEISEDRRRLRVFFADGG